MIELGKRVQVGTMINEDQNERLEKHCKLTGQKKGRVIETALNLFVNSTNPEILETKNVDFVKLSTSVNENQYKSIQKFIKEQYTNENKRFKMYQVLYSALERYFTEYNVPKL